MWTTSPTTKEMYPQQLAAFWRLTAPRELPTLPGIGGDGAFYQRFGTPKFFWNSKYIETLQVKRIILSKAPVIIRQEPWGPILADSVHAYAWWTLTKDELTAVVEDQRKQSTKRPASQMIVPPPIAKGPPLPKSGAVDHPETSPKSPSVAPKETQKAKAPIVKVPSISSQMQSLQFPTIELPVPKRPQQPPSVEFRGNAGVREPSVARGRKSTGGSGGRIPFAAAAVVGKGTPSIPPPTAVGMAAVPNTQLTERESRSRERSPSARSRSRDPLPEASNPLAPIISDQQMSEIPAFMAPLMSAMGLGHLPASQQMIQEMNELRTQAPLRTSARPTIHDFFEGFLQVRALQDFAEEFRDELPRLQQLAASQTGAGIPPSSQLTEPEGEPTRQPSPTPRQNRQRLWSPQDPHCQKQNQQRKQRRNRPRNPRPLRQVADLHSQKG